MTTETTLKPQERIEAAIKDLGLSMSYKFVPFSMSRNKDEKHKSLNWIVTLNRRETSLSFEYSAGIAHCPAYSRPLRANTHYDKRMKQEAVAAECEHGKPLRMTTVGWMPPNGAKPIIPKDADVIHSIVLDASVLDEPSFESWADNCGYDTDSRKAEAVYKACLEIALKLRAMIGDAGLRTLQEACQDY
jgi:hypothetical protein